MIDPNSDRIYIHDLEIDCIIGVNPEERIKKQRIVADIEIYTGLTGPGTSDSLEDTISYSDLARNIIDFAGRSSCMLIERMAEEIAGICLENKRAAGVRVTIKKPGAIPQAKYAGVEIYRTRKATP